MLDLPRRKEPSLRSRRPPVDTQRLPRGSVTWLWQSRPAELPAVLGMSRLCAPTWEPAASRGS